MENSYLSQLFFYLIFQENLKNEKHPNGHGCWVFKPIIKRGYDFGFDLEI